MRTIDAFQAAIDDMQRYTAALGPNGWLTLAAVVFLVTLGPSIASRVGRVAVLAGISSEPPALPSAPALLAVVAVGFLLLRYLVAVVDLLLVESLCTNRLPVLQYVRHNLRDGIKLLGFRLTLFAAAAAVIATPLIASGKTTLAEIETLSHTGELALVLAVVLAVSGYLIVGTLTTTFVVPIMQRDGRGPLAGWRRFWAGSRGSRPVVAGYLLFAWLVSATAVAIKFVVSFVIGSVLFVLAVIFLSAVEGVLALEVIVGGLFMVGYLLFVYLLIFVLTAPVTCYLRYAALELLQTADDDLDFLTAGNDDDSVSGISTR